MFRLPLWEKLASQMEHLNGFCPSFTVATCCLRLALRVKLASQMEHLNGFSLSCTVSICLLDFKENKHHKLNTLWAFWWRFNAWISLKLLLHILHVDNLNLCTIVICLFRFPFWLKLESKIEHLNGFCPSWTVVMCLFRSPLWVKIASQMKH